MLSQWRSNLWLVVELMIVSVVLWYIADYLFVRSAENMQDEGFDPTDVYLVKYKIGDVPEGMDADSLSVVWARELGRRIGERPDVECWSLDSYCTPYFRSMYSSTLENIADSTASLGFSAGVGLRLGFVSPGYFSVLRIGGINGETPAQMDSIIAAGEIVVSDNVAYNATEYSQPGGPDISSIKGTRYLLEDTRTLTVGGVMKPQLRSTYESVKLWSQAYIPLEYFEYLSEPDLLVRLKDNASASKFIEEMCGPQSGRYCMGSLYLNGVRPLDAVRRSSASDTDATIRTYTLVVLFFLLNIFLGLLGTFWFRTQRRTQELAIRMVAGATRGRVLRRILSEALLLLVVATLPAVGIDWMIGRAELLTAWDGSTFSVGRFCITVAMTFGAMAVMVISGTLLPAMKAMRINPSTALQSE